MKEYIEIGSSPYDESCAQVGTENYRETAKKEMNAYIDLLERTFPDARSMNIVFKQKWFEHDFGSYGEVCAFWNPEDELADSYIYEIEADLPAKWDEESLKKLENSNV